MTFAQFKQSVERVTDPAAWIGRKGSTVTLNDEILYTCKSETAAKRAVSRYNLWLGKLQ